MTKNSFHKKAARAYQQAHPGTSFTAAMQATAGPKPDNTDEDEQQQDPTQV